MKTYNERRQEIERNILQKINKAMHQNPYKEGLSLAPPIRKLRPRSTLTSGQRYALEAFVCMLIGAAIALGIWWGLPV